MRRYFFIIALVIISSIIGCKDSYQTYNCDSKQSQNYNIQINYHTIPNLNEEKMFNNKLWILFDGNYAIDTVSVMINNKHFKDIVLTTDHRTGLAGDMETIQYKRIENIGLRINKGKLIYIEPEKRHYNIRLTYLDSIATIRFYRKMPSFY